jgi:cytochrome c biogenesis protein CcdA
MLVGILLAVLNPSLISNLLGKESGWIGIALSAIVGAITLIPGFVAFPTAAMLLKNGAGYMQIGAFISALMMVGLVGAFTGILKNIQGLSKYQHTIEKISGIALIILALYFIWQA